MPNTIKVNKANLESAITQFEIVSPPIENLAEILEGVIFDSKKLRPSVKKQMNELAIELASKVRTIANNTESFHQDLVKINNIVEEIDKGTYNDKKFTLAETDNAIWTSTEADDVWELLNVFKKANLMSGTSIFSSATIASAGTFYPVFSVNKSNQQTWSSREEWQNYLIEKYKTQGYNEEESKELASYEMASQEYIATGANVFGKDKVALSALYVGRREILKKKIESNKKEEEDDDDDDDPNIPGGKNDEPNGNESSGGQTSNNPSKPQVTTTSAIKARIETPTPSPTEQQKVEEVLPSDTPSSDNVETPSIDENTNQISGDLNNNANVDIPSTGDNSNSNNNNITTNPETNPGTTMPVNNGNTNTTNNSVNYSPSGNTYYGSRNNSGSSYNSGNYGSNEPASISNPVPDAENISTTTPSSPESDANIVDKSGEELDVISIDREVSSEPTTSSGGGSVIPAVLGVGAAGAAAVAGIKLMKNKKEKENTYEDESSEDINSFSYLNNYPEDDQDSVANLNEELE